MIRNVIFEANGYPHIHFFPMEFISPINKISYAIEGTCFSQKPKIRLYCLDIFYSDISDANRIKQHLRLELLDILKDQ